MEQTPDKDENTKIRSVTNRQSLLQIFFIYLPLLMSKMLMSMDNTVVNAFLSRMEDSAMCIAAHGGIVIPVAQLIEAPICMLISASIALNKDRKNYLRVRRLARIMVIGVLCIQILICLPPVFDLVIVRMISPPAELLEYIRVGLRFIIPYSAAIGIRRFNQGILIRFGETSHITIGTIIRFIVLFLSFTAAMLFGNAIPNSAVTSMSLSLAVMSESAYITYHGYKCATRNLSADDDNIPLIGVGELIRFTAPLSLTNCVSEVWTLIGSAAVSRMPDPLLSLSVWPVISAVLSIFRSFGGTLNETSLGVLQKDTLAPYLKRFILIITTASVVLFFVVALTPVNELVFGHLFDVADAIQETCRKMFPLLFPVVLLNGFIQYKQAVKITQKKTIVIFESLLVYIGLIILSFAVGIRTQAWPGIYVIIFSMDLAFLGQMVWLSVR